MHGGRKKIKCDHETINTDDAEIQKGFIITKELCVAGADCNGGGLILNNHDTPSMPPPPPPDFNDDEIDLEGNNNNNNDATLTRMIANDGYFEEIVSCIKLYLIAVDEKVVDNKINIEDEESECESEEEEYSAGFQAAMVVVSFVIYIIFGALVLPLYEHDMSVCSFLLFIIFLNVMKSCSFSLRYTSISSH
jgi:hypothetical protein